jgi:hypothetical protein
MPETTLYTLQSRLDNVTADTVDSTGLFRRWFSTTSRFNASREQGK